MRLRGAIAAAVTPMREGGRSVDVGAVGGLTRFLAEAGIDGVLVCGTTGEGILLGVDERVAMAQAFLAARPEGFAVAVHAGAQTTADTVALASHAREAGADAVAVIAPPYFPLDDEELFRHLRAAADACAPTPFYVYEFVGRSGYAIAPSVVERLRHDARNVAGLKVSDAPIEAVEPYLLPGLDVFVGLEPLALQGFERGATGVVSGLATAFPEVVTSLAHDRSEIANVLVGRLRDGLDGIPFIPALKQVLVHRGILMEPDVRAPLRPLTDAEAKAVVALAEEIDGATV